MVTILLLYYIIIIIVSSHYVKPPFIRLFICSYGLHWRPIGSPTWTFQRNNSWTTKMTSSDSKPHPLPHNKPRPVSHWWLIVSTHRGRHHCYKDDRARTWHLKDGNPGVSDVVEGDGVLERVGVGGAARCVVAIPVDARRRVDVDVGRRRRVAARAVDDERNQVDALGHSVAVRQAADDVETSLAIERRQRHAPTRHNTPAACHSHAYLIIGFFWLVDLSRNAPYRQPTHLTGWPNKKLSCRRKAVRLCLSLKPWNAAQSHWKWHH